MGRWREFLHPRRADGRFKGKGGGADKAAKSLASRNYQYHHLRTTQNQFLPDQAKAEVDRSFPQHKGKPFGPKPKGMAPTFRPSAAEAARIRREEGFSPPSAKTTRSVRKSSAAKKKRKS